MNKTQCITSDINNKSNKISKYNPKHKDYKKVETIVMDEVITVDYENEDFYKGRTFTHPLLSRRTRSNQEKKVSEVCREFDFVDFKDELLSIKRTYHLNGYATKYYLFYLLEIKYKQDISMFDCSQYQSFKKKIKAEYGDIF